MTTSRMNPKANKYFSTAAKWREEMAALRKIILGHALKEELKWGKPCYTFDGRNVVLIVGFKEYCSLLFCKGALLKDAKGILIKPGAHTQATRQIRFTSVRDIVKLRAVLKTYIDQAIEAEKAGLDVAYKKPSEFVIPEELQKQFKEMPALKTAFESLTPGRQRAYVIYFTGAKQSSTRESRIKKCAPQILEGIGLHDEYRARRKQD